MLVSHSHKFIFVHIYKNGGSSINHALAPYNHFSFERSGRTDKLRFFLGLYPKVYSTDFSGHETVAEIKRGMPSKVFRSYFKFAFVRHPVDWQKSLYRYALEDQRHHQHELTKGFRDFDEYLDWRIDGHFNLQKSFVTDSAGSNLLDYVGKLENFENDFKKVVSKLGINDIQLPHVNKSQSKAVNVSAQSRKKIEECFKEDYLMFGYE